MTMKKVGGLRFVRIGRLSFSFCITKAKPAKARAYGVCLNPAGFAF